MRISRIIVLTDAHSERAEVYIVDSVLVFLSHFVPVFRNQ